MIRRLIARYLRHRDRARSPRPVVITPDQWRLYLNNQSYRNKESPLWPNTLMTGAIRRTWRSWRPTDPPGSAPRRFAA